MIDVSLYTRAGQNSPLSTLQVDENWDRIKAAFAQASTGVGSVTSVALSVPTGLSVSGSPITSTGTLAITTVLNGIIKGNGSGFTASATLNILTETTGTLSVARGGTGATTLTGILVGSGTSAFTATAIAQGDLFYGSATGTLTALAKNATATRYLSNTGTSNNPAWAQVALATGVSGILPYANGGTNYAASSRQDLINNLTASSAASTDQVLTRNSGGNAVWSDAQVGDVTSVNLATGVVTLTVSNTSNPLAWSGVQLNIPSADAGTTGLLTAADWIRFNSSADDPIGNPNDVAFFNDDGDLFYNDAWQYDPDNQRISLSTSFAGELGLTIKNTNNQQISSFYLFNDSTNGLSAQVYGSAYAQLGTLDIASTVQINSLSTNWWVGTNSFKIWTGAAASEIENFRVAASLTSSLNRVSFERGLLIGNWTVPVSLPYTVLANDSFIYVSTGTGDIVLPNASSFTAGHIVMIKKATAGFASITTTGGQTINGAASYTPVINELVSIIRNATGNSWDVLTTTASSQWITTGSDIYYSTGNVGIGATTAPNAKLGITKNSLGSTQTAANLTASGIVLENTTAAVVGGTQQISPALRLRGRGSKTAGGGGEQPVDWYQYVLPKESVASPLSDLIWGFSTNAGTLTEVARYRQDDFATLILTCSANAGNSISGVPGIKFKGAYNSGDGFEFYQSTLGTVLFNINGSLTSMQIGPDATAPLTDSTEFGIATSRVANQTLTVSLMKTTRGANTRVASFSNSGTTINATAAVRSAYGIYTESVATRSSGSNNLTNIGLYATASGGQLNYAAILESGNVGIGTTTPVSTLHHVGSLSVQPARQVNTGATVASGDYTIYAINAVNTTLTFPLISTVGYGKVFVIKGSPTASTANLTLTPASTDRFEYGTAADSTYTLSSDYASVWVMSVNSGSYDFWLVF